MILFALLALNSLAQDNLNLDSKPEFENPESIGQRIIKNKKVGYFSLISNFSYGSSNGIESGAGFGIEINHFAYNGDFLNLGYFIGYDYGLRNDNNINSGLIGLLGTKSIQFEFLAGVNYAFIKRKVKADVGIGMRMTGKRTPLILRIGAGTTSWVNIGFGVNLGTMRNGVLIKKSKVRVRPRTINNTKVGYFSLAYHHSIRSISSFTGISAGIRFNHFLFSNGFIDIGYYLGYDFIFSNNHNIPGGFIGLLGKGLIQFEFRVGGNFIIGKNDNNVIDYFDLGIGMKLSASRSPIFFRIGVGTPSYISLGLGFNIGTARNIEFKDKNIDRYFEKRKKRRMK